MRSWVDRCESAKELAHTVALKLKELDPENDLLPFWFKPANADEDPFESEEDRVHQMKDRFWGRDLPWEKVFDPVMVIAIVVENYYIALKVEIQRLEEG